MKKKTKRALGIGVASAAAFAAGIIISASPAYAEENCSCEPGNHAEDCVCGCSDAGAVLKDAEGELGAAHTGVTFTEREELYSKQYAEAAAKEEKEAEEKKDASKAAYDKAVADEEASVKAQQDKAKSDEQAKSDALMQANVEEGQAETAANEAQKAADDAKEQLDTAKGYKDGTLPIEDTDEYKNAQETRADLDKKTGELDTAQKAADDAKADADSKKTALDAAQADYDSKKKAADDKQAAQDSAQEAKDAAQTAQDANEQALNKAAEEKDAADKNVTDKTAAANDAQKAKEEADKEYQEAADVSKNAGKKESDAKKALDDYLKEAESKKNSVEFFRWLSQKDNISESFKADALLAVRILTDKLTEEDKNLVFNKGNKISSVKIDTDYETAIKDTHIGDEYDATYIDNLEKAVDFIAEGNRHRGEESQPKPALSISSSLMAISAVDTNHLTQWVLRNDWRYSGHTEIFDALDNMSTGWGLAQNGKLEYPKEPINPYEGWYYEEKENYETNNGGVVGHYLQLIANHTSTGFALSTSFEPSVEYPEYDREYFIYNQSFGSDEGISVNEYKNLISEYKAKILEKQKALQDAYDKALADYNQAKVLADDALTKKQAADKALESANSALKTAQDTQTAKQAAYDDAVAAEADSNKKLKDADEALASAKQANDVAQAELSKASGNLGNAKQAKETADKALAGAGDDLNAKKAAFDTATEADKAADKALAALMDVDGKQEAYNTAVLSLNEANNAYDISKKAAADAQTAYDEAKRALDVANILNAEDAQSVKDAKAAYEAALKEYEEKAAVAKEKQAMYETDKEYYQKAAARLVTAQKAYEEAKAAAEAAQKLCESHIVQHKDIFFKFNFKDEDGNVVNAVHTEFYVDDKYIEGGEFGHEGLTVNTKNVLKIFSLGQTGGFDEYRPREARVDSDADLSGGLFVRFAKTRPDSADKDELMAVLTDKNGKILSGDWFVINGADLKDGKVELTFLMDKVGNQKSEPVPTAKPDPVHPSGNVNDVKAVSSRNVAQSVVAVNQTSKAPGYTSSVTTAASTGDNGYSVVVAYTILAAAAAAGLGIALKKRKKTN